MGIPHFVTICWHILEGITGKSQDERRHEARDQ